MPSGAKKRKAAKKKKVHQGENDGGEISSLVSQDHRNDQDPSMEGEVVEVKKKEDNSSEIKSNSVDKNSNEEEGGNIEIEIGSKSKSSNGSSSSSSSCSSDDEVEKKVVVLESAPIESLPENVTQKDEDLEISPVVEHVVKPVDSSLEGVSQDCDDEPKNVEKKDLVVEEKAVVVEEQTAVVGENELKDDCLTSSVVVESVSKENGVAKLASLDEKKASLDSKDGVASSTSVKDSISEVNGANRANDNDTIGHSDRQPPDPRGNISEIDHIEPWSC
ncbi:hypothetical protein L6452_35656 [Arctium lappa]|uniref:Uncharacterized protein n=1 Tax=Arctium lappa TaxID=4217 RepID=A0ACB8Y882_ARCLA|nr:hypothetical protein L6452_35656 [Arctium lappa]